MKEYYSKIKEKRKKTKKGEREMERKLWTMLQYIYFWDKFGNGRTLFGV